MCADAGGDVEREAADLMQLLDGIEAGAQALGTPVGGVRRLDDPELVEEAQRYRDRSRELEKLVSEARRSAQTLIDRAQVTVDKVRCDRIQRHEWPVDRTTAQSRHEYRDHHYGLQRAIDFIDEHASESVSLDDIVVASRVGCRHLQGLFRRHCGTSPMNYLRSVRLDHAHRELSMAEPGHGVTVESVAKTWHFPHLGRFAGTYRERFGCSPSQTLRTEGAAER